MWKRQRVGVAFFAAFVVVVEDKLGYKWARWVNRITLSGDANYKGYWEQRGYDNNADIK